MHPGLGAASVFKVKNINTCDLQGEHHFSQFCLNFQIKSALIYHILLLGHTKPQSCFRRNTQPWNERGEVAAPLQAYVSHSRFKDLKDAEIHNSRRSSKACQINILAPHSAARRWSRQNPKSKDCTTNQINLDYNCYSNLGNMTVYYGPLSRPALFKAY
jgi:hypothetical protein